MPTTFTITGSNDAMRVNAQNAINDPSCVDGDIILLPFGTHTWSGTLTNVVGSTRKHVWIRGQGQFDTVITGSGMASFIDYTCKVSSTTAVISHLTLHGGLTANLMLQGEAVVNHVSGDSYNGGIRVHHVNFTMDIPDGGLNPGHHMFLKGWVMGVMDHCSMDDNMLAVSAETMSINHGTSPTGGDAGGDYAFFFPEGGGDLSGTKDAFYIEDCILKHVGALTDCTPGDADKRGAGMVCARHNTFWGGFAGHGTRESGTSGRGQRLLEQYNNLHCYDDLAMTNSNAKGKAIGETRDGEVTCYNNFISIVGTKTFAAMPTSRTAWQHCTAFFVGCVTKKIGRHGYGADGVNPWDENQKANDLNSGSGVDGTGAYCTVNIKHVWDGLGLVTAKHYRLATYDYDTPTSAAGVTYSNNSSGGFGVDGKDHVRNGVDLDTRMGDVFGTATVPSQQNVASGGTITNVTINSTGPSTCSDGSTDDYWRGFFIRNADLPRNSGDPTTPECFAYIVTSTFNSSTNTWALRLKAFNEGPGQNATFVTSAHMELRRVRQFMNVAGGGQMDTLVDSSVGGETVIGKLVGGGQARWCNQTSPGTWFWGNMVHINPTRSGTLTAASFVLNEDTYDRVEGAGGVGTSGQMGYDELTFRNFHHIRNGKASGILPADTKTGYYWDNTVGAGNPSAVPACRVGADWVLGFSDGFTNGSNVWSSFYTAGTGGWQNQAGGAMYPHPLIAGSAPPANAVVTVSGTTTVAAGDPNAPSYTISSTTTATGTISIGYTYGVAIGDTAVAGTDYTAPSGSTAIQAGQNSVTVKVTTLSIPGRTDKIATFKITSVSGTDSPTIGTSDTVVTTITNVVTVSVSVSPASVTEGSSATFTITASGNVSADTTVNYAMSGTAVSGTNYTSLGTAPLSAVIASGTKTKTVSISTLSVTGTQANLTAIITLGTGTGYQLGASGTSATLIIADSGVVATPPIAPTIVVSA